MNFNLRYLPLHCILAPVMSPSKDKSVSNSLAPKVRVKPKPDETHVNSESNFVILNISQKFKIIPESLETTFANLICQSNLLRLNKEISDGVRIFHTRLNTVSTNNKKEGFALIRSAIRPTAQVASYTKDELIAYSHQFTLMVNSIEKREQRINKLKELNKLNGKESNMEQENRENMRLTTSYKK